MGAWGVGIRQSDVVCDVIALFEDRLKAGKSIDAASKALVVEFDDVIADHDEGPLFWIGLADVQWTYGELDPQVLRVVREQLAAGLGLAGWSESARRRVAVESFIAKIAEPNPRPKKVPKIVVRPPKFAAGDCLSIRLHTGQYAAALVLAADHSDVEHGQNLICTLDYLADEPPSLAEFGQRQWLVLSHHNWKRKKDLCWYDTRGFRAVKDQLTVIGRIEIQRSDPKTSNSYAGWGGIGSQILLQREWDAGRRR